MIGKAFSSDSACAAAFVEPEGKSGGVRKWELITNITEVKGGQQDENR
jgi:hypothetical protein